MVAVVEFRIEAVGVEIFGSFDIAAVGDSESRATGIARINVSVQDADAIDELFGGKNIGADTAAVDAHG